MPAEDKVSLSFRSTRNNSGVTVVRVYLDGERVGDLMLTDRQTPKFDRIFASYAIDGPPT